MSGLNKCKYKNPQSYFAGSVQCLTFYTLNIYKIFKLNLRSRSFRKDLGKN